MRDHAHDVHAVRPQSAPPPANPESYPLRSGEPGPSTGRYQAVRPEDTARLLGPHTPRRAGRA